MGLGRKIIKVLVEEIRETGRPPTLAARGGTTSGGKVFRATAPPPGECPGGCGSRGHAVKKTGWCGRRACKAKAAKELGGI